MSEVSTEEQVAEPSAPKPSVGERLRAAREALGMETGEVASALKLSKHQVEALEAGDWSRLPGNTFVRGFVRNYARVVKLDAATLLPDLESPPLAEPKLQLPQSKRTVLPESGQVQRRDYAAVLAGMVLVAIAVVAYYVVPPDFWQTKPREALPVAASEPAPLFPPANVSGTEWMVPPPPNAEGSVTTSATTSPAASETVVAHAPSASSGKGLVLNFAQPSWVEIRDRSGQIVFSQLNQAGTEQQIDGQPPFSLVVGNAAHVTVRYQGRTIELQPRSKDDVARVTVE